MIGRTFVHGGIIRCVVFRHQQFFTAEGSSPRPPIGRATQVYALQPSKDQSLCIYLRSDSESGIEHDFSSGENEADRQSHCVRIGKDVSGGKGGVKHPAL